MSARAQAVIVFTSAALPDDTFAVAAVDGSEAMSAPFSFTIDLLSERDDLDLDALLEADASLGLRCGELDEGEAATPRWIRRHGVLARIERGDAGGRWTAYRATLAPRLWRASLARRSRVFLDRSVPEVAQSVLGECGLGRDELVLRLARPYARREYAVQHDESDLAFVSRLLEHEGIFYRFEHGEERSLMILGDAPEACARGPAEALPFNALAARGPDESCDHWHQPPAIHGWSCRQAAVPAEARVQDRNWRAPAHDLRASARVADRAAFGASYQYGDVQRDADEGARFARIRAEELRCCGRRFAGRSNSRDLAAGAGFSLSGHTTGDGRYLVTELRHRATQQLERGAGADLRTAYANDFICLPEGVAYRPARTTPRPRIAGAIHAVVDAAGAGDYAELDEHGRYRVRLPFDLEERGPGAGSRPVRMAQPYAGAGMGLHFPLHKGAEVLLVHVNGDPDRPVIAGALANPTTANVVTSANQTQGVLRSASGNELRFEDAKDHEQTLLRAVRDLSLDVVNDRHDEIGRDHESRVARHRHARVGGDQVAQVDGEQRVTVAKRRALRVGGDATTEVDGARTVHVKRDQRITVDGSMTVAIGKDLAQRVDGDQRETIAGAQVSSARRVLIEAQDEIVLKAGSASITLRRDGSIVIAGGDITLKASGTLKARAVRDVAIKGAKLVGN